MRKDWEYTRKNKRASQKNGQKMKLNWNWWFSMANLLVSIFVTSCPCHDHISCIESLCKRVGKLNMFLAQWHVFNKSVTRGMSDTSVVTSRRHYDLFSFYICIVLFCEFSSDFHYHHYSTIQRWKIRGAVMIASLEKNTAAFHFSAMFCHIFCHWKYFVW